MIQEQPLDMAPPLHCQDKSLLVQVKHKVELPFGQPYLDSYCELRQNASSEHVIQCKFSKSSRNSLLVNEDELGKSMPNSHGFLQEKDSSFGVLNWESVRNWKYNERMPEKCPNRTQVQHSSCFYTAKGPPKTSSSFRKQPSSYDILHPSIAHGQRGGFNLENAEVYVEKDVQPKEMNITNQEFQASRSGTNDGPQRDENYGKNSYKVNVDGGKSRCLEKEMSSTAETFVFERANSGRKKNEAISDEKSSSSECSPVEWQRISILPEHFPNRSCLESSPSMESRTSLDEQFIEEMENKASGCSSPEELYPGEFSADVPCSFPHIFSATCQTKTSMQINELLTPQSLDADFNCPVVKPALTTPYEGKYSALHDKTKRHSFSVEVLGRSDISKLPAMKEVHASPTHRFGFKHGRNIRSFSAKESSVPKLSLADNVADSHALEEFSSSKDNIGGDEENSRIRRKSSPLRRLLDPLLKYKGALSVQASNESMHSIKGSSQDRKPGASTFQALVHLTLKNGHPFFKLRIGNSSNEMMAAFMNRLPSSKADGCTIYAFYSVLEIRKKGTHWMNQRSKSKRCGLGYNMVGRMKISSSYPEKTSAANSCQSVLRECVLYDVDPGLMDKKTSEFVSAKEIVAIVVKNSFENLTNKELSDRVRSCNGRGTDEIESHDSTVVILPDGVHGLPYKGKPSSLISRWRSGGMCDCGGWDVGCKLRILTSHSYFTDILERSCPESTADRVNLFIQGGNHKNNSVFRLKPVSGGLYSIEFESSISLLEAFATSVAFLTCKTFSEILDHRTVSDIEQFQHVVNAAPVTFQGQVPTKYCKSPCLSPLGRI